MTIPPLPGPRGLPLVGTVHPFLRHGILGAFVHLADRYGPCYRLSLPLGHTALVLSHPDAVQRILRDNRANYPKGSVYDGARLLLGNGLVTSEGEDWERQRALAQPAFKNDHLVHYLQAMYACTEDLLREWWARPAGEYFDLHRDMSRLTLAIVGRTLFGLDLSHQTDAAGHAFTAALRGIGFRGPDGLQVPMWLPTPGNLRFRTALKTLDAMVYDIIRRFRATGPADRAHTLLGALMTARDQETGRGMSDRQLRDEVITLYLAGYETTANLLTWTFYVLAEEAEPAARVEQELGGLPGDRAPSLDELKALRYTPMVLSEVLRLYGPVWTIARNVLEDDAVCGYRVPAGSFTLLAAHITHRLEEFWPDPERFDPERFGPQASRGRHPFAWYPFSAGPRVCIGKHFSLYEAQLILARILREYRLTSKPGPKVGCKAEGTLRPDRPVWVRLTPKAGPGRPPTAGTKTPPTLLHRMR